MAILVCTLALLFISLCCVLAAYEERLSPQDRFRDDMTRWMWNYLGLFIALGNGLLDVVGFIALVVRKASERHPKRRSQE